MIAKEEKELLEFGLRQGIHNALNWLLVVLVGICFSLPFWQSLLFYFFYCYVRVYAGGYHAKTRVGCYICSVLGIGICFFLLPVMEIQNVACILGMAGSIVVILLLAPMDNPQKRLSKAEKSCFQRKAIRALGIETALFFIAIILEISWLYGIIVLAMTFVSCMLLAGWVKGES